METSAMWRRPDGAIRAPWQVAGFCLMVAAATILVGGILYSLVSITPLVRWARIARVSVDAWIELACVITATSVTAKALKRQNVWKFIGVDRASSAPRVLVVGTGLGLGVMVAPTLALVAAGGARFAPSMSGDSTLFMVWSALALFVPAALTEELLFRGFAFAVVREAAGDRWALALTSAAFGLAHLLNPSPSLVSIAGVVVAGGLLGVVRLATGSLLTAFVTHLAINVAQLVILHAPVSGLPFDLPGYQLVPTGPEWLTGGSWGPEGGVAAMLGMLTASFLLLKSAPKRPDHG